MLTLITTLIALFTGGGQKPHQPTRVENIGHIKHWEGLRLEAYLPTPRDKWTIGYGHTATVKPGMVITEKQAEKLLRADIKWVRKTIKDLVEVPLSQPQYDALASLIFNIGRPQFSGSTLLRKLNTYDYVGAADEFPKWRRQKGRILPGLVRRRKAEQRMFLEGTEDA